MEKKTVKVVAAVIRSGDRIFATRRGYGEFRGYWEFPGGKTEPGEKPKDALKREIKEELDADIKVGRYLATVRYEYPDFRLQMRCYLAEIPDGHIELREHSEARWLSKEELGSVEWLPADLGLIAMLGDML